MRRRFAGVSVLGLAALLSLGAADRTLDGFDRYVRPDGSFVFPGASASDDLVHLGTWFVPEGDARGFHNVYTQPEARAAYRATGAFPDGAVLLKEIRRYQTANYTTGTDVASEAETVQWFRMVKDRNGRHPDHPLWKEGWGWALFKADAPTENAATSFAADCQACHLLARSTDWVYKSGYPR
jgi:hypothetical protein